MLFNADLKSRLCSIPLEYIVPNPLQPRKYFDPKELRVLAESILRNGLLQPVIVRKLSGEEYELISGERRYRASLMAGLDDIPCIVLKCTENQSVMFSLFENLRHERLNMFEEADVLKMLITDCRLSKKQIAKKLGKSVLSISDKLMLLSFSEEEQKIIIDNHISESHAKCVIGLDKDLRKTILGQIAQQSLSISQTEQLIDEISKSPDIKQHKNQNERFIIKDVRIFLNTFAKAIELMQASGIDAQSTQTENEMYIEYIVRIPKTSAYGKGNIRSH